MPFQNFLPVVLDGFALEIEHILQFVAVRKPQPVEVSDAVPPRFHKLFGAAADNFKAFVESVVAGHAVSCAAADVEAAFPEVFHAVFFIVALNNVFDQKSAVASRHPFKRHVETGVKHQPVLHIVGEHSVMKYRGLP